MAHTIRHVCGQQGGSIPQQYSRARRGQGPAINTADIPRLSGPYIYRRYIFHTYALQDDFGYWRHISAHNGASLTTAF